MRCGKRDKEPCNSDDECSSEVCSSIYGVCQLYTNGPSDGDGSFILPLLFSIVLTSILFTICYCIIRCCYKKSKK